MKGAIPLVLAAALFGGGESDKSPEVEAAPGVRILAFGETGRQRIIRTANPSRVQVVNYPLDSDEAKRRGIDRQIYIIERNGQEQYRAHGWLTVLKVLKILLRLWS